MDDTPSSHSNRDNSARCTQSLDGNAHCSWYMQLNASEFSSSKHNYIATLLNTLLHALCTNIFHVAHHSMWVEKVGSVFGAVIVFKNAIFDCGHGNAFHIEQFSFEALICSVHRTHILTPSTLYTFVHFPNALFLAKSQYQFAPSI